MSESNEWTPYPHEEVRVRLLWRKRILLGLILGTVFLIWALSLGVTTDTENQLNIYGSDGSQVTVQRPDDRQQQQPSATVELRPGETARLDEDLRIDDRREAGERPGPQPPEPEPGIPWLGLFLLLGPFLLAAYLWRYLTTGDTTNEVNYGIYKGASPFELVTASHDHLVLTGKAVERNPFGKARNDYLREAVEDPARTPYGSS